MILLGHPLFEKAPFFDVLDIDSILKTPPQSTLYIEFSLVNSDILDHCRLNNIHFAVGVKNIKEAIFAHNYNASYIIVSRIMAASIQKIAENYLFDAKVIARIDTDDEIEEMANLGIDGVIFANGIVKAI